MIWPDGDPSESLMDHLYQVELKVFITITITITMMIIITSIIIGCIITIVNLYGIYGQRCVNITFWYLIEQHSHYMPKTDYDSYQKEKWYLFQVVFFLVTYVVPMVGLSVTYSHLGSVLWAAHQTRSSQYHHCSLFQKASAMIIHQISYWE